MKRLAHRAHVGGTGAVGHRSASAFIPSPVARRHASLLQRLQSVSNSRLANAYAPGKFTAKGIPQGPQAGVGFDPVYNNYIATKMTGPLRRKSGSSQEDYYDVDELAAWMEAKHAATLLNIKEGELPTLTKAVLEERWKAAYCRVNDAKKEEVLVATEVLLEYIDSALKGKKSKQYYRNFLQSARLSIDEELSRQRSLHRTSLVYGVAFLFAGASFAVLFVAYFRKHIDREDAKRIGARAADYVAMTFFQSSNIEDPPDYQTRYFHTPSAMDVDKRSGSYDDAFLNSEEVRVLKECEAYSAQEEAEMLRMLNEENDAALREARGAKARGSRVSVVRSEDLLPPNVGENVSDVAAAATGQGVAVSRSATVEGGRRSRQEGTTFQAFAGMMASGFGGGSRFQRLTKESSARAEELRKTKERRRQAANVNVNGDDE